MIINLKKFMSEERPIWTEFDTIINRMENDPEYRMTQEHIKRFHYLYQRTSADLAKIMTFSSEPSIREYLESLVARAYSEIHETREKAHRLAPLHWFFTTFPQTFRRHIRAFCFAVIIMLTGCIFGGFSIALDPDAKAVLMPFPHLMMSPSERVAQEERAAEDRLANRKAYFSSYLMTHNTQVSILALGLGITWGIGTVILVFVNGIMLGAVAADYILAGEINFLIGWLLPHGAVEIPSILLAAQSGFILAGAIIGRDKIPLSFKHRIRAISGDLVTLIFGVAILLIWAGIVESFFSQYHEPVIPYIVKIGFGIVELVILTLFLGRSGKPAL